MLLDNSIPVERCDSLSRQEFTERFTEPCCPLIVTKLATKWPAFTKWTFEFLSNNFGSHIVHVADRLISPTAMHRMPFQEFIELCLLSARAWDPADEHMSEKLYCGLQLLSQYPELNDDISHPDFITCLYRNSAQLREWYLFHFGVVLVGCKGAFTPFHRDLFFTHGWLAQISGRKQWVLVPPDSNLVNALRRERTPQNVDGATTDRSRAYTAVIEPGEMIFVPAGWYHAVTSLDPTISVGFNFVNETNFGMHILGCARDLSHWASRLNALTTIWKT